MKSSVSSQLLFFTAIAVLNCASFAADLATYRASAPPGASPDANNNSVDVWEVAQGDGTGSGLTDLAGDQGVWQIFDTGGTGAISQTHKFTGGALTDGQAVSIDYAHNNTIESGKRVGLRLLEARGKTEVEIAFPGGEDNFVYTDASAADTSTGQKYNPRKLMQFSLRVTGTNTYEASLNGNTWTGTVYNPIAQIQVFNDDAGDGSDQYTDNLVISTRQATAIERQAQIGAGTMLFVPQGYKAVRTPSFAFAAPLNEQGDVPNNWRLVPNFFQENGKAGVSLNVPAGSSLYGTGEQTGPLLRNEKSIMLWNTDSYGYGDLKARRLYQSHPWVLGVRPDGSAFGILFDTTWKATLTTGSEKIVFNTEGAPFRVAVIDRESPQAVLRGLAEFTGKMPLPPKWALGFHQCRYSYYPDSRVREIADEFRKRSLPCDVIWLDIHYMHDYRIFTFDPSRFPDPKATNDYLHEKNFHSVWMIDPGIKKDPGYSVYDDGTSKDLWVKNNDGQSFVGKVWPGDCVFPDFTMPATRKWWAGLYKDYMATGIDGVWNDMNEPAVFETPTWTMPEDNQHRGGGEWPAGSHRIYHNVYGMLMVAASRQGILDANPEKRPFILTRSNYLGGQRYAATWTGDNNAAMGYLEMSIPMSLNLGLSGQPLSGPDVGGYSGAITPELYGKWIAMAPFYPFSRAHTDNQNPGREPWVFGPQIEDIARTALERRYRLMPYLYTLAYTASTDGDPIMQPVFFADPKDPSLRAEDRAFLFGPDLLVIPQWAENSKLPKGIWRDVSLVDEKREKDGYQPALKIRGGSILPLGKVIQSTNEKSLDPLTLLVCLDANGAASGKLYEDADEGFGYEKGEYALTSYQANREGDAVIVRINNRQGKMEIDDRQIVVRVITENGIWENRGAESKGVSVGMENGIGKQLPSGTGQ